MDFLLQGIGNVDISLLVPLTVSYLANLAGGDAVEMQNKYDRVRSNITAQAVEGSITKIYFKKLRLHHGLYK